MLVTVSLKSVEKLCNKSVMKKAKEIMENDYIVVKTKEVNVLAGKVRSSKDEFHLYDVRITLNTRLSGVAEYICSCPYVNRNSDTTLCKHGAAVILSYI